MNKMAKVMGFVFLLLISSFSVVVALDSSHYGNFELEAEQHWETYGVGGTCISGTHNLATADVDGDGVLEMVTGGFMYRYIEGSRTTTEAPLKIWSWNGQDVNLKANNSWSGNIGAVYAADVDSDGLVEVITAGNLINETGYFPSIRIWHCSNGELSLQTDYEGVSAGSIFVGDLDGDKVQEIVTVGRMLKNSALTPQLCLWHYSGGNLTLVDTLELDVANVRSANSVYASDLNGDGNTEIITAGYSGNLNNSKGQLCLWSWDGHEFTLEANEQWQLVSDVYALTIAGQVQGNTIVNNVKASDTDGDGVNEVVTGGFAYDGEKINAQLRVWTWNGNALTLKDSKEWTTDYLTEVKCLALSDVDGDGKNEIITSGMVASKDSFANETAGHDRGQLKVWGFNGANLMLENSVDWSIDDGACAWNVAAGDVDNDGVTEIVTVGCIALGTLCDPDLRIWSLPQAESFPYLIVFPAIVGVGLLVAVSVVYVRRRRQIG